MNTDQIQSFIRQALTFFGGILVSYGWFDSGTMTQIVGALATLVSVSWSYVSHSVEKPVSKAWDE